MPMACLVVILPRPLRCPYSCYRAVKNNTSCSIWLAELNPHPLLLYALKQYPTPSYPGFQSLRNLNQAALNTLPPSNRMHYQTLPSSTGYPCPACACIPSPDPSRRCQNPETLHATSGAVSIQTTPTSSSPVSCRPTLPSQGLASCYLSETEMRGAWCIIDTVASDAGEAAVGSR